MKHAFILILMIAGVVCSIAPAAAKPAPDSQAGRDAYMTNCARCHGDTGRGDGPDAARMVPRPRDFTTGTYKFRTTPSGSLPTDDDLFHTISVGLAGTRMPAWDGLSEETRWQLVNYLKGLSQKFAQGAAPAPVDLGKDPGSTGVDPAKGKKLYTDMGCAACHGTLGRANGPSAKTLVDDWGQPSRPANLTHGWTLRGGAEPRDLVTRLATGVDGTPMPSYAESASKEDLWQLAYYLRSLQEPAQWSWTVTAARAATTPTSPMDAAWNAAPRTDVTLWSNVYANGAVVPVSVGWAMIQALATADTVAFRIGWDDRSEDRGTPPDQFAVVFKPAEASWEIGSLQSWPAAADAPALDVCLWSAGTNDVRHAVTNDFGKFPILTAQLETLGAQSQYADGRWWLVLTRPRPAMPPTTIPEDAAIPLALVAWDGGNGDTDRHRSVSTWLDLQMPPSSTTTTTKENHHEAT